MSRAVQTLPIPTVGAGASQLLAAWVAAAIARYRKMAQRRELAALSDRQLRDVGIDPSLAGRGRAAVVRAEALRSLESLS